MSSSALREYRDLKCRLAVPDDGLLDVFERFCERSRSVMHAMEWSWKLRGEEALGNRVFWLGAGDRRVETSRQLRWLARELRFAPAEFAGRPNTWDRLLETRTDRALVAYSGPDPSSGRPAVIKLYLCLDTYGDGIYSNVLRPMHPGLHRSPPPAGGRAILAHSVDATGASSSRVYLLYHQWDFDDPDVAAYLTDLAGERAVAVARRHPSAGIALKNDTTDMLGLSLRPTGRNLADHPSWWDSPVLRPVLHAAGRMPILRARLRRISWVTVPLDPAALEFPYVMPEMNVYVRFP